MKLNLFSFLLFALPFQVLRAQTESIPGDSTVPVLLAAPAATAPVEQPKTTFDIEIEPSFPGGLDSMFQYLYTHVHYPAAAKRKNVRGEVVVSFVVERDGAITHVKLLKDIGKGCGQEVVRAVRSMPRWSPGSANGHPVKVRYTLPMKFKLE